MILTFFLAWNSRGQMNTVKSASRKHLPGNPEPALPLC